MGLIHLITGLFSAEITSADIPGFLTAVKENGITLFHVYVTDALTVCADFYRSDLASLQKLVARRGEKIIFYEKRSLFRFLKRLAARPVLVMGLITILLLAIILPTRVLFIKVEGNDKLPTELILEKAQLCGIHFGASRRDVRSEQLKNRLLTEVPQLQWAGINTSGCSAIISVEERAEAEISQQSYGVSSIIAVRDGIIESCTVTKGNALCKVGQAVKTGEILVSGYTDCGILIQAARAEGEIFAQTSRELRVVTPTSYTCKGEMKAVEKKYSMIIGKKRINFYKDSGISDTTCDKMYREYRLTLPGGFALPVAFAVEQLIKFDNDSITAGYETSQTSLMEFADFYLPEQMISGSIQKRKESFVQLQDVLCMQGQYVCLEMIGRVQREEIIGYNGKTD